MATGPVGQDRPTSYLDLPWQPSYRPRGSRFGRGRRRAKEVKVARRRRSVGAAVLGLLVIAALVLAAAIVGLAKLGLKSVAPTSPAKSLLVVPAPAAAGGLPRHTSHVRDDLLDHLAARFIRRFDATTGSYTDGLDALYREPGIVDLATGQPGWVMYLGYNSPTPLGPPGGTIRSVMAALITGSATDSSWVAAPGPRGGSARCAVTLFGATTVSLCAWATERTVGALMSPTADTKGKELAALMPLMRLELQG